MEEIITKSLKKINLPFVNSAEKWIYNPYDY